MAGALTDAVLTAVFLPASGVLLLATFPPNAVLPETPQSLNAEKSLGPEGLAAADRAIPEGRGGRAGEVSRATRFPSSGDAARITGQQFIVDGGLTARFPG